MSETLNKKQEINDLLAMIPLSGSYQSADITIKIAELSRQIAMEERHEAEQREASKRIISEKTAAAA